jgi:chromosome segregation ATPase
MISNRLILGIVAFGVSFGISLVLSWDFGKAILTGIITVPATYLAALYVDKRRRNHEMLILDSLHRRIKELETSKSRMIAESNQLEILHTSLYTETKQLQNQALERRKQRDILNRENGTLAIEKKQLETQINQLQNEIINLDKVKVDLSNSISNLNSERRRLELNSNVSRSEINQLHTQLGELLQQKQERESELILLERLKPQLEEKLYNLRVQIQEQEVEENKHNELLLNRTTERESIENILQILKNQLTEQQREFQQIQGQISLLQEERDQLQNQVWELLQHLESFNQEPLHSSEQDIELFPFSDLIEILEPLDNPPKKDDIPSEWIEFIQQLPEYETEVLKAILEEKNPNQVIKRIAETQITMPNLLIDSINQLANNIIGELIIDPIAEKPEIYQEHITNAKRAIAYLTGKQILPT